MELGPIFRALLRNKTGAILIALQCALTLAIVVNAVFIIQSRIDKMGRPTGMDDDNLISVMSIGFVDDFNGQTTVDTDLAALRALDGVVDATPINAIPQSGGGSSSGFRAVPEEQKQDTGASYYEVDSHALNTLGLKLIEGRNFRPEEQKYLPERTLDYPRAVIISQAMAKELFPNGGALGKTLYSGAKNAYEIVGIVERMQAPWINWRGFERTVMLPLVTTEKYMRYMIRTEPGRRDDLMPVIEQTLNKLNNGRIIRDVKAHSDVVKRAYQEDKAMAILLVSAIGLIVAVTALGIVGLATFSVNRRTRQIGTRRALGASQQDILRYFLTENWLITSVGVVAGIALSVGLNIWLVESYSLDKLDWRYLPFGALFIWALGLLAVFAPALKAARTPPAIATRTV
ncbi:FtsX-like permease family protein [Permianibacter sp. IMCC34836]|uniref:ABC transporter permease n=1 Tax=Permianibacter fluminis TaxID=2738515 RepID=UPI001555CCDD|nr:FtsX-like permease family protein [Permianibacter fluminis]NQD35816.1 FtsX-like permease family protein [Permianibacter fluminis]